MTTPHPQHAGDLAERIASQLYYELGPEDPRPPWVEVAATVIRESIAPIVEALNKAQAATRMVNLSSLHGESVIPPHVLVPVISAGVGIGDALRLLRGE